MSSLLGSKWITGLVTVGIIGAVLILTVASPSVGIGQETDGATQGTSSQPPGSDPDGAADPPASFADTGDGIMSSGSDRMLIALVVAGIGVVLVGCGYAVLRKQQGSSGAA